SSPRAIRVAITPSFHPSSPHLSVHPCGYGARAGAGTPQPGTGNPRNPFPSPSSSQGSVPAAPGTARWPRRCLLPPHSGQPKGRSPVCVRRCRSRWEAQGKHFPQSLQPKGRSRARPCLRSVSIPLLPHSVHSYGLIPVCSLSCLNSVDLPLKNFSHSEQW
uniref:Uncharacterized protein n=1 Tax=Apteryx owenii TaxID=8824 RepID=A0A8B9QC59_APTOW